MIGCKVSEYLSPHMRIGSQNRTGLGSAVLLLILSAAPSFAAPHVDSSNSSVERGLRFLQKEAFDWKATRKCAACHHASLMLWAANEARNRGYSVDEPALKELTGWAFGDMKTNSLTEQAPPRNVINLGWVYVLLSVETAPALKLSATHKAQTPSAADPTGTYEQDILSARETLLRQIVSKQAADGSWGHPLDLRVPLGGPTEDIAILSRLALVQSGDKSKAVSDCIEKAGSWLAANHDETSRQARNLRLLMSLCEEKPRKEMEPILTAIRAEQNPDGGWSQTPEMKSDAYATGQTLYVLARSGVKPAAPEMQRGVEFLNRTQRDDGSWPMTSRVNAKNLSPITATGTAWAVLGLVRVSP
jgi:hypothetical protein